MRAEGNSILITKNELDNFDENYISIQNYESSIVPILIEQIGQERAYLATDSDDQERNIEFILPYSNIEFFNEINIVEKQINDDKIKWHRI